MTTHSEVSQSKKRIFWILYIHRSIRKTCLYSFNPLKPHFYRVKVGFTSVYINFLFSAQKHRLWVLVRTASPCTHNLYFEQKYENYHNFSSSESFHFLVVKFSIYLNSRVFVMSRKRKYPRKYRLFVFFFCTKTFFWVLIGTWVGDNFGVIVILVCELVFQNLPHS